MNFFFWRKPKLANLKEFGEKGLFFKWYDANVEVPAPYKDVLVQYAYDSLLMAYWHEGEECWCETHNYKRFDRQGMHVKRWADIKHLTDFTEIYRKDITCIRKPKDG